ncbi:hypothetical protein G9A89_002809 [Geosiphon pyriformis]|nr:hypothetical protein G9A89_002809 [Geosiphon pyriformis]
MKATASGTALKKKAPKGAFHGPAGGFFSQKKKVVLGNVKHSGNEKDLVASLSGENEDVNMFGTNGRSLLGSAATTPKAKQINTGTGFGSPLGFPNFHMDDDEVVLPPHLLISLEKKWIDPKIIKTPVKVSIRKLFALNINLSAVENKLVMAKTHQWFWGATTPSKFEGIIRSTFTFKKSINMAVSLAREKGIVVNTDLRKSEVRSDQAVIIKKIPMDTPKEMIVAAVAEFGEIKLIKIQLIGMWQKAVLASRWSFLIGKNSVHVAKAFRALLFTLLVRTTMHDLGTLLNKTVVGFEPKVDLDFAFSTKSVFGTLECDASDVAIYVSSVLFKKNAPGIDHLQLAKLYAKKNISISCPTVFGGKSWTQVVFLALSSGSSPFGSSYGLSFSSSGALGLGSNASSFSCDESLLAAYLASLEHSLELLADQVSGILRKLSFVKLVPMVPSSGAPSLVGFVLVAPVLDLDMALNGVLVSSFPPPSSVELGAGFNLSSSKILTTKISGLESKMSAIKALVSSVLVKLDLLCSGLGFSLPLSSQ